MNRRELLTAACSAAPSLLLDSAHGQSNSSGNQFLDTPEQRASLKRTGDGIRAAFAKGDVDRILAYHHPGVIKALSYQDYIVGREALKTNLTATLQAFRLEFVENLVESVLFHNGTAVEMSLFAIRSTPKAGGASTVFKGRSMVTYITYPDSPTGWASIRETVQSAS